MYRIIAHLESGKKETGAVVSGIPDNWERMADYFIGDRAILVKLQKGAIGPGGLQRWRTIAEIEA